MIVNGNVTTFAYYAPAMNNPAIVAGILSSVPYIIMVLVALMCSMHVKELLFKENQGKHPSITFLAMIGIKYLVPLGLLDSFSGNGHALFLEPLYTNPFFWMSFGYTLSIDTYVYWTGLSPDDEVEFKIWGRSYRVKLIHCLSPLIILQVLLFNVALYNAKAEKARPEKIGRVAKIKGR
jgi:hypothetical protein